MLLTISNVSQPTILGDPEWIRVYRWGDKVGTLRKEAPWKERWTVEARRPLYSETEGGRTFVLETADPLTDAPLPLSIDDVWEEERVPVAEGATWNRALCAKGSSEEILRACRTHQIVLSSALLEHLQRVSDRSSDAPEPALGPAPAPAQRVRTEGPRPGGPPRGSGSSRGGSSRGGSSRGRF
jgi:hypothetical protein